MINNFKWSVNIQYTRSDCSRNSTLEDIRVESINVPEFVDTFIRAFRCTKELHKYCIDRIVRHYKPWDLSKFDVEVIPDYYGEEIAGVTWSYFDDVIKHIENMLQLSDIEKIFYVLKLEYGFVLDRLAKCTNAQVITVDTTDVKYAQQQYYNRLEIDVVNSYADYDFARAVCIEINGYYDIIDGYHRLAAANNSNMDEIKIIVLTEE